MKHLQDKAKSRGAKEAILSAFISGILARELAEKLGLSGWENYYIGAMFHNFGRLLAMYYFPDEFAIYQQLLEQGETDEIQAGRVPWVSASMSSVSASQNPGAYRNRSLSVWSCPMKRS